MRSRLRFGTLAAVTLLAVILAGCGSAAATPAASSPAAGASVAVTLDEWSLVPSSATASAGEITFQVTNSGDQIHEFVVVRTDLKADDLPVSDNKIDESALTPVDEIEDIAAGASPTLTVELAAGHYVLLCNIETHYAQGMRADFDVN